VHNIPDCKLKLSYADNGNVAKLGTITDYSLSGENNDGTLYGDCYVDADGMHFTGANDAVVVSRSASLVMTSSKTIAAWVYLSAEDVGRVIGGIRSEYLFYVTGTNLLSFRLEDDDGVGSIYTTSNQTVAINTWYHVAAVYKHDGSPTQDDLTLYVNGIAIPQT